MGASFAKSANFAVPSGLPDDGSQGLKLEFTSASEKLLKICEDFIGGYSGRNGDEANLLFKDYLSWETTVKPTAITAIPLEESGDGYESKGKTPLLKFEKVSGSKFNVHAKCLRAVEVVYDAAEKKLSEIKNFLERNADPAPKMLGERFSDVNIVDDNAMFRFLEEMMKSGESEDKIKEDKMRLKILIQLRNLDQELMKQAIDAMKESNVGRLTPQMVDIEVEAIRCFSGSDENNSLVRSISYVDKYSFVHKNGCRAPIWRQVYGDIAYIKVLPFDGAALFISASTQGFYVNQGWDSEANDLAFAMAEDSEHYPDLSTALKKRSPHFLQMFDNQSWEKISAQYKKARNIVDAKTQKTT